MCLRYPSISGKCVDSHQHCKVWAGMGECKKNTAWMSASCRLSCKLCGTRRSDIASRSLSRVPANWCLFSFSFRSWLWQSKCVLRPMVRNQQQCDVTITNHFNNLFIKNWHFRAKSGECEKNAPYMQIYCPKACKLCGKWRERVTLVNRSCYANLLLPPPPFFCFTHKRDKKLLNKKRVDLISGRSKWEEKVRRTIRAGGSVFHAFPKLATLA